MTGPEAEGAPVGIEAEAPGPRPGRFDDDDLKSLFSACDAATLQQGLALAVSGGSDSTALLVLFARWRALETARPARVLVVTVDHGLRPDAAREAECVKSLARSLDMPHETLAWEGAKPRTGIAEAARSARYGLIAGLMRARDLRTLLTAHTADDQAETLLMRLARGSGLDGLSAMAPVSALDTGVGAPIRLVRPLLGVRKARLQHALAHEGIAWFEDPSNDDDAHERPRLRRAASVLEGLGLSVASLSASAQRLQRARAALDATARSELAEGGVHHVDPLGFVTLDRDALLARPEEIALRVLGLAIAATGGRGAAPVSLSGLEALLPALAQWADEGGATLAGAMLKRKGQRILVEREPGRTLPAFTALAPGQAFLWDGRFLVRTGAMASAMTLGPLGPRGLGALEADGWERPRGVSANALHALPALWKDTQLVAVPQLKRTLAPALQLEITIEFRGCLDLAVPRAQRASIPAAFGTRRRAED